MDVSEKKKKRRRRCFRSLFFQQRMDVVGWKHPGFRQEIQFRTGAAWLNIKSRLCRNAARYAAKDALPKRRGIGVVPRVSSSLCENNHAEAGFFAGKAPASGGGNRMLAYRFL